jgi:hypothetical protein
MANRNEEQAKAKRPSDERDIWTRLLQQLARSIARRWRRQQSDGSRRNHGHDSPKA